MSTYSIIIPASKPRYLEDCVDGVTRVFPDYQEILIAMSPNMPAKSWDFVESLPRVKLLPGTNKVKHCGQVIFNLMDHCQGDWIINADDDDVWVKCDRDWSDDLPSDVGFVSGSSLYCTYRVRDIRGCIRKLTPKNIDAHSQLAKNCLPGSFRLIRRSAYQQVKDQIRREFYWNDYRLVCELISKGFKAVSSDEIWGVVRRFDYRYDDSNIPTWEQFLAEFRKEVDDGKPTT